MLQKFIFLFLRVHDEPGNQAPPEAIQQPVDRSDLGVRIVDYIVSGTGGDEEPEETVILRINIIEVEGPDGVYIQWSIETDDGTSNF